MKSATTPNKTIRCPIMAIVNAKTINTVRHVYLTAMAVLLK